MEAKEIELSYYAGLFDGEGCIHIARIHTQKRKLTYQLVCRVSMYSLPVLEQLKTYFGGSIYCEKNHPISNKYGMLWSWSIFSKGAEAFLNQIKSYLRIKKPQAELALQFQGNKARTHRNRPKTEAKLAIEEAQYILMRSLKKEFSYA
ncbi:hypothetical protein LCGC14_1766470 [marine sediment metagenome]|uniref:Homing endonuclease LAGLIDADG domain-containing protein n=1 Tax=marine sediment metagenome TaxID=412755 RepID=A0A0F9JED2_9ZZZZ